MIDRNETVVNTYRYSPFGESLVKNETVFNPYQYTGRRFDEESGQYYYRARMYSAEQARFTSSDPAKDGANWYAYVGNNPINARDPNGESWDCSYTSTYYRCLQCCYQKYLIICMITCKGLEPGFNCKLECGYRLRRCDCYCFRRFWDSTIACLV